MLLTVQILSALFAFVYMGHSVKKDSTRFDKVLCVIACIVLLVLIVYVEVVLK